MFFKFFKKIVGYPGYAGTGAKTNDAKAAKPLLNYNNYDVPPPDYDDVPPPDYDDVPPPNYDDNPHPSSTTPPTTTERKINDATALYAPASRRPSRLRTTLSNDWTSQSSHDFPRPPALNDEQLFNHATMMIKEYNESAQKHNKIKPENKQPIVICHPYFTVVSNNANKPLELIDSEKREHYFKQATQGTLIPMAMKPQYCFLRAHNDLIFGQHININELAIVFCNIPPNEDKIEAEPNHWITIFVVRNEEQFSVFIVNSLKADQYSDAHKKLRGIINESIPHAIIIEISTDDANSIQQDGLSCGHSALDILRNALNSMANYDDAFKQLLNHAYYNCDYDTKRFFSAYAYSHALAHEEKQANDNNASSTQPKSSKP